MFVQSLLHLWQMKIYSYNLNGIRAACKKGLADWIAATQPDVLCFQELKANVEDIDTALFEKMGYYCSWFSAQKKGYSGTGVISKIKPTKVIHGNGQQQGDFEGRTQQIFFDDLLIVNTYFPSGSSGDERQNYKMTFLEEYLSWLKTLQQQHKQIIVCGDYNICHKAIDIHDPVGNKKSSGFLPEEREWMDNFFETGMVDSFRVVNPHPHQYSWWSNRMNARGNNKGWRIDYISISEALQSKIKDAAILPNVVHSDHCPVFLEIDL
jgi:exodeoxyribonuclease III